MDSQIYDVWIRLVSKRYRILKETIYSFSKLSFVTLCLDPPLVSTFCDNSSSTASVKKYLKVFEHYKDNFLKIIHIIIFKRSSNLSCWNHTTTKDIKKHFFDILSTNHYKIKRLWAKVFFKRNAPSVFILQ